MVMITCPQCGQHVLDVASACPKCGCVLMQNPLEAGGGTSLMACRRCGKHIDRDAVLCPFCGYHVRRSGLLRRGALGLAGLAVVVGGTAVLVRTGVLPAPPWHVKHGGPAAVAAPRRAVPLLADTTATAAPIVVTPSEEAAVTRIGPPPPPPGAVPSAPAPQTEATVPALRAKWTAEWANIRADRTVESAVVRVLAPGMRVEIGDLTGGWWAVYEHGARVGYIANSVLGDAPVQP
jgi:hypothetical protein